MLIFERSSQVGRVVIIYGYGPELSGYLIHKWASLGQQEWKWVRLHVSLSSRLVKVPFGVVISRVPRTARGNRSSNGFQVTTCFIFASVPLALALWTECLCPPQFICGSLNPPSHGFKRWDLWHELVYEVGDLVWWDYCPSMQRHQGAWSVFACIHAPLTHGWIASLIQWNSGEQGSWRAAVYGVRTVRPDLATEQELMRQERQCKHAVERQFPANQGKGFQWNPATLAPWLQTSSL